MLPTDHPIGLYHSAQQQRTHKGWLHASRSSSHQQRCKIDRSVSGSCSHVGSSLHDRALTCICGWHAKLCSQTMSSGGVSEPMQWFPLQNHACFYAVPPECLQITGMHNLFTPCPLHIEISPDSQNNCIIFRDAPNPGFGFGRILGFLTGFGFGRTLEMFSTWTLCLH